LVQLQSHIKELEAAGVQVVGISYDPVTVLKAFSDKRGITFPLLSDTGSKTIDAYHIRNKDAPERVQGIPEPGTFILDQKGVIRAKLFYEGYKKRHDSADIIRAAKKIG
jgi:peroxiredoxin Q/BCP